MNDDLLNRVKECGVIATDENGNTKKQRQSATSIELPIIDEAETMHKVDKLYLELLKTYSENEIKEELIKLTSDYKEKYNENHMGFNIIKGAKSCDRVTVSDIYVFSIIVTLLLDKLVNGGTSNNDKIAIGVLYPAVQDCGKNIIKLLWKSTDLQVIDLGKKVQAKDYISAIQKNNLSLIGVSCMVSKSKEELERLIAEMKNNNIAIPVVIGGIAVNRIIAYDLFEKYGIRIYYSFDLNDTLGVLKKALNCDSIYSPKVITGSEKINNAIEDIANKYEFHINSLEVGDIVVDEDCRRGCEFCSGEKKLICPLEIGYEKRLTLGESHDFIKSHSKAFIVSSELIDDTNNLEAKRKWNGLIKIESELAKEYGNAICFKFPITCPFCKPQNCSLKKGYCMLPIYYRSLHETYNINITKTIEKKFGEFIGGKMYSIILCQ